MTNPDTGTVTEVVPAPIGMPGEFRATMAQPTQRGDSGGGATIEQNGQSYLAGVLSGVLQSTGESQFTYLDAATYGRLTSGMNSSDFQGLPPDIIEGQDPGDHIRGGQRKANIITNGDNSVVLAGAGGGLVNTGVGNDDVVLMPSAAGESDPGTTFVVSPGSKTLVGGGPNDKLVVLTDQLVDSDAGVQSPSNSSSTIQLLGAYSDGGYGTDDPTYLFDTSYTTEDDTAAISPYDGLGFCNLQKQNDGTNDLVIDFQTGIKWTSQVTLKNFKNGDFGFNLIANNEIGEANVKQNCQQVFDDEYTEYKNITGPVETNPDINSGGMDWAAAWNGRSIDYFKQLTNDEIAQDLKDVEASSDGDTWGPSNAAPTPDQTISGDDLFIVMSGTATDTVTGNRDTVTASGSGGTVHFGGTGEAASISNGSVDFWDGANGTITGDGNMVTLNSDAIVTVSGSGDSATLQGTDARLSIHSASIDVFDGASGSITGDGNTLSIFAGATVTASGDGLVATLYDTGSSLTMSGKRSTVNVASTGEAITAAAAQIDLWDGAGATVTGDGNAVTLNNDDTAAVSGTGTTATIQGTGDVLTADGARVGITDGSSATVSGQDNTMTLFGGAALGASGKNDTFVFSPAQGNVLLTGYDATDELQFSTSSFVDWHDLLGHTTQQGPDTIIQTDPSHTITLVNVALSQINQDRVSFT